MCSLEFWHLQKNTASRSRAPVLEEMAQAWEKLAKEAEPKVAGAEACARDLGRKRQWDNWARGCSDLEYLSIARVERKSEKPIASGIHSSELPSGLSRCGRISRATGKPRFGARLERIVAKRKYFRLPRRPLARTRMHRP